MSNVRSQSGVPPVAAFRGAAGTPLVIDTDTGYGYTLKDGDVVVPMGMGGTVTSVGQSFTGGLISVAGSPVTVSGTLALTVAGTSGGVPYFSTASAWASSGALAQHGLVYGGGAGAAPNTSAALTNTRVPVVGANGRLADSAVTGTELGYLSGVASAILTAQAWTTPAFSAGDFTASGSMTWTVAAGDVATYAYVINGKMMSVNFAIETTTVGGTPAAVLRIAIPASKVNTKRVLTTCVVYDNSGSVREAGVAQIDASGTVIQILKMGGAVFTASTDLTYVYGSVTFEIN